MSDVERERNRIIAAFERDYSNATKWIVDELIHLESKRTFSVILLSDGSTKIEKEPLDPLVEHRYSELRTIAHQIRSKLAESYGLPLFVSWLSSSPG